MENMHEFTITSRNLYARNGVLYLDARDDLGNRFRFSSGLNDSKEARAKMWAEFDSMVRDYVGKKLGIYDAPQISFKLKDICAQFLADHSHIKKTTKDRYLTHINAIQDTFKNIDVRYLSQNALENISKEKNNKPFTFFLNRIIRFLRELDVRHIRPINTRGFIQKEPQEILPFSLQEIQLILQNIDNKLFLLFFNIAFFSGLRTGEIMALVWEDIDLQSRKIRVNKTLTQKGEIQNPKTLSSNRYVDIIDILLQGFREYIAHVGHINPKNNIFRDIFLARNNFKPLREYWKKLLQKCGLKYRHLYHTRHTFATIMLENREDLGWVSAMLGHKNQAITMQHYIRYIPRNKNHGAFFNFTPSGDAKEAQNEKDN